MKLSSAKYRVALEAIRALHLGSVRGDTTFISSTPGCHPTYRQFWHD
jgi:hypothetical protein